MSTDDLERDAVRLTLAEVEELAHGAFRAHRTSAENARSMARSIAAAEADGLRSHGLLRLPTYCEQAAIGKVDGFAVPIASRPRPAVCLVDARAGFAHPAIDTGSDALVSAAKAQGIATLAVTNSYNCGVVGHHVERLAEQGLIALGYANTPVAIAPWGGSKPLFGTNPIAFAAPRTHAPPIVIDQSASVVARGEIMLRASQGLPIPEGWALDERGAPTTDPQSALRGSMLPAGGYKGASIALMVEILAGTLTGANQSFDASSFLDTKGGPPRTGQLFIALDPVAFLGEAFGARIERLVAEIGSQPDVRLPGQRRFAAREQASTRGVSVQAALHVRILKLLTKQG